MPATAYKSLAVGREPCHGGTGAWPEPGLWTPELVGLVLCKHGYHVCRPGDLLGWLGPELWRVEWRGESVDAGDKLGVGQARLVERVEAWDERNARLFACDCAERVVHLTGPDERCVAAIATARRFALGEATEGELTAAAAAGWAAWAAWGAPWAAAREAAWAAALDAAGTAPWEAAVVAENTARDADWGTASGTAWEAACKAAGEAAGTAAWEAERCWQRARLLDTLKLEDA